jgi:tryptophan synthase alpha chain
VGRVREATTLPVAVGFGISSAEQAAAVGRLADGVVVGSALVDVLGTGGVPAARTFLGELRAGLDLSPAAA